MSRASLAKIKKIEVRSVRVPMTQPHKTASGTVTESPLVLVDIHADDGTVGHALVFTYTVAALKPTADLIRNLAPLVEGEPLAPVELEQKLSKRFRLLGTQGIVGMALAGIDMALWDAFARMHDLSLVQSLGGVEKQIPAYGAVGYDGPEQSARIAEDWAKRGFKGVKAKIGYPTVAEDLSVIRSIRSAVGNGVAIMVDYNQCLTPTEAIERAMVLDDENLAWIEEPTLAHDYRGHARISREAATPIQCGENWWGPLDMQHAIDENASDYMMPDVMKIGGVSGWMKVASMAYSKGIRLSTHLWPEVNVQLLCATPTAHWLEYADWWNPIVEDPLLVKDGIAHPLSAKGSGVSWNEKAVQKFLY